MTCATDPFFISSIIMTIGEIMTSSFLSFLGGPAAGDRSIGKSLALKQFWARSIFLKRPNLGELHHLFTDLIENDVNFFTYSRMFQPKFEELLVGLTDIISRQKTNFLKPITLKERSALTRK